LTNKEKNTIRSVVLHSDIRENLEINPDDESMIKMIEHYIETHKWLVSENIKFEATVEQAIFSWYENVYRPLWHAMRETMVLSAFPDKKPFEIFAELSDKHYYAMENSKGFIQYNEICKKYILEHSKRPLLKLLVRIGT
jgi:hypothetical protein